jgi:hypothetical protein
MAWGAEVFKRQVNHEEHEEHEEIKFVILAKERHPEAIECGPGIRQQGISSQQKQGTGPRCPRGLPSAYFCQGDGQISVFLEPDKRLDLFVSLRALRG